LPKTHRDRIAVVTGAASGIGQAFAQRLAEDGCHVVIADVQAADETLKAVERAGRRSLYVRCDVSSPEAVAALAAKVEQTFGRCDILVNNAGIFQLQPFEQISFADWRRVLSINLDSAFLTAQAFAPGMKRRGWGRIVNMASSTFGTVTLGYVHYIASKGGMIGLTRALARLLQHHGHHAPPRRARRAHEARSAPGRRRGAGVRQFCRQAIPPNGAADGDVSPPATTRRSSPADDLRQRRVGASVMMPK
jgi:NAD(P)-dependent dehydrogenase (short-subunit alcohol dehydrogenase family)